MKAAEKEEAKTRLQGWPSSQATEAVIQTTTPQSVSLKHQIPRWKDGWTEATDCDKQQCKRYVGLTHHRDLGSSIHLRNFAPINLHTEKKRSKEDTVATALHAALSGLQLRIQHYHPTHTGSQASCFLVDRRQRVWVGRYTSSVLRLIAGSPQACVLSPLLYSLYNRGVANHSNANGRFVDDTAVVGEKQLLYLGERNLLIETRSSNCPNGAQLTTSP